MRYFGAAIVTVYLMALVGVLPAFAAPTPDTDWLLTLRDSLRGNEQLEVQISEAKAQCNNTVRNTGCTMAGDPTSPRGGTGPAQCALCCDQGKVFDTNGDGVLDELKKEKNCMLCCAGNFAAFTQAKIDCENKCAAYPNGNP